MWNRSCRRSFVGSSSGIPAEKQWVGYPGSLVIGVDGVTRGMLMKSIGGRKPCGTQRLHPSMSWYVKQQFSASSTTGMGGS